MRSTDFNELKGKTITKVEGLTAQPKCVVFICDSEAYMLRCADARATLFSSVKRLDKEHIPALFAAPDAEQKAISSAITGKPVILADRVDFEAWSIGGGFVEQKTIFLLAAGRCCIAICFTVVAEGTAPQIVVEKFAGEKAGARAEK